MNTFSYKKVGNLSIKCDVYVPTTASNNNAILWLHGGGLIGGSRKWIPSYQLEMYLKAGYTVIAADYRLIPETKLPDITEDVIDAFQWVTNNITHLKNIGIVGHSGGGYLALLLATKSGPRPNAVVSFYGYGAISADWYTSPSEYYLNSPEISETEAKASTGTNELSDAADKLERFTFYTYCRQRGIWPDEAMGLDPDQYAEKFLSYSPSAKIDDRCPPTLLIHGDKDWDVPYDQSVEMQNTLVVFGNTCELLTIDNGGHMFDCLYEGDPPASGVKATKDAIKFLNRYLA